MDKYPWKKEVKWERRTVIIASIIRNASSVLDLGGGYEQLKKHLDNCSYRSIDKFECTTSTQVADFNQDEFPDFIGPFDYVVCQGTIEYIKEPEKFLKNIQKYGKILIITYKKKVESPMWRNNLTFKGMRNMLDKSRWEILMERELVDKEIIFYCKQSD